MLFTAQTVPFVVATFLLLAISIAEGLALLAGGSLFLWVEPLMPSVHVHESAHGVLEKTLGWLHIGRVPLLIILVTFLAAFAVFGFGLNIITHHVLRMWVRPQISVPIAGLAALPAVRLAASAVARMVPQDRSFAVTLDSLVGRVAIIIGGLARKGYAAQATVTNQRGQTLYVMVEPDGEGTFREGACVLLVRQLGGNRFAGIPHPRPDLL